MTAEIAILNRGAVALASDSAVTISTKTGPKIYDSANKLFTLVKGQPVGVMIYDSADHLGVPWETIIKAYRMSRKGAAFPRLTDYAKDFLDFVANCPDLIPPDLHTEYLKCIAEHRTRAVVDAINSRVGIYFSEGGRSLSQTRLRKFMSEAIAEQANEWNNRDDAPWSGELRLSNLRKTNGSMVDAAIARGLQKLPTTAAHRAAIRAITFDSLCKLPIAGRRRPIDPRSGVVIAGFGEREFFPRLISYDIYGSIDGHLRAAVDQQVEISTKQSGIIAPFAQRDMVDGFMTGINPQVQIGLGGYLQGVRQAFPKATLDLLERHMGPVSPDVASTLGGPLTSLVLSMVRELERHMERLKDVQVQPVIDSVAYLPKDELAAMAESLVNLTSLKRRISIDDPQTVGGPVDVAVISRGDGFVWIKRKHYFTQQLNPTWASMHTES